MARFQASASSKAALTSISTECRLLIYNHLFKDSKLHVHCSEVVYRQNKPHVYVQDDKLSKAITQTCQLLRQESLPILWSETVFHFNAAGVLDAAILTRPHLGPFAKHAKRVYSDGDLRLQKDRYYHVLFKNIQVLTIHATLNDNELMWPIRSSPDFEIYLASQKGFMADLQKMLRGCSWFPKSMLDKRRRRGRYQLLFDIVFPGYLVGGPDMVCLRFSLQKKVLLTSLTQSVLIDYDEERVLDERITYPANNPRDESRPMIQAARLSRL